MSAYYVAEVTIKDPDKYLTIREKSNELIERYKGKVLAADSDFEALKGDFPFTRIIIIEFPSEESLTQWYHCDEYTELKKIRDESADARVVMVRGL